MTNEQVEATKSAQGRRARRRGRDFERAVAKYLGGELVPLSGALGGKWSGDVTLTIGGQTYQIQTKRTKALTTQRRWLQHDGSDILVQANPREPVRKALVVMELETFRRLINCIQPEMPLEAP
ncbi:hypothetical protein GCM10010885_10450 [Alicyclobacillus cellulosilyticus]|uniref:Uncharacterized protein n=1 Tax=Alicyclobacillus cellulosilyticus TaxID=1003997 RepID=A0A917KAB0_9BACL|nr:hypothetical protein [Alicyclobacillus cellulosilyticus]GGJ03060.1 hypothetical protein GCM10010885_10450 [Alicyclobacillus cellulosilyticus]